jgi:hypothetical protein
MLAIIKLPRLCVPRPLERISELMRLYINGVHNE